MNKKRFSEINIMRIIGFLLVVDQHILGGYAQRPEAAFGDSMVLHFLYLIGRPAVPMFVAITGFTLFNSNYQRLNLKDFYVKRTTNIVLPYLFWSFATIIIFHKYNMLKNIFWVLVSGTASYHLWYMGMIIRLYIWFPLILKTLTFIMKKDVKVKGIFYVAFCLIYWIVLKNNQYLTEEVSKLFFGEPTFYEKRFIQYTPIYWSIYFVCGATAWFYYDFFKSLAIKYWKLLLVIQIPLTIYMYYTQVCSRLPLYFPRINYQYLFYILYMLNMVILIYIVSLKLNEKLERLRGFIEELSALSYGAYLIHVIVLQKAAAIIRDNLPIKSYLLSGLLIFIISSIVSLAACWLIHYMPLSQYIIGVKTKTFQLTYKRGASINQS